MPTLWPAGPWRFEAAVTITECNEQSVTNGLQFAQIAEYVLPVEDTFCVTDRHRMTDSVERGTDARNRWFCRQRSDRYAG
jgi:hypothetical protein